MHAMKAHCQIQDRRSRMVISVSPLLLAGASRDISSGAQVIAAPMMHIGFQVFSGLTRKSPRQDMPPLTADKGRPDVLYQPGGKCDGLHGQCRT